MVIKNLALKKIFDLAIDNFKKKNFEEAKNLFKEILKQDLNNADIYNNLGLVYKNLKEFQKSEDYFKKAIEIDVNYISAYINLGNLLKEKGELKEAVNFYIKSVEINSSNFKSYNNLGAIFHQLGELKKAIDNCKKAIQINPNYLEAHYNLANILKEQNEFEAAIKSYQEVIKIQPKYISAHINLMDIYRRVNNDTKLIQTIFNLKKFIKNEPSISLYEAIILFKKENFFEAIKLLESISFNKTNTKSERLRLNTLGDCYDRMDDTLKAFHCFEKLNKLSLEANKDKNFNKNKFLNLIEERKIFFKGVTIKKKEISNFFKESNNPIFMVGFPRSGTTLLNTILNSHPKIEVIEEKPIIPKFISYLSRYSNYSLSNLDKLNNKDTEKLKNIYFDYLNYYIKNKDNSKIYIDKLPLNIIFVGEIIKIFPKAKFIFSLRHPCDCVLSSFMQDFKINEAMSNFYNLRDTSQFYNSVMTLWTQYEENLLLNSHTLKYESLVENFDETVTGVLKFLGLTWHDSLIKYYKKAQKRELISTSSFDQVTKPIYHHAIGRWKRYKQISEIYPILDYWVKKFKY